MADAQTPAELEREVALNALADVQLAYFIDHKRTEGGMAILVFLCTLLMTQPLLSFLIVYGTPEPVVAWFNDNNVTAARERVEQAATAIRAIQSVLAFLHFGFLFNSIRLQEYWALFSAAEFQRQALIEQLFVLDFFACFLNCWDSGYSATKGLGLLLFVLAHMRFADLARHWWCQQTFFPMVIDYPHLMHWMNHRHRRAAHVHAE